MKLIKLAAVCAIVVSGSAFAVLPQFVSETVKIYQNGGLNGADVDQNHAFGSLVDIKQDGVKNFADVYQSGNKSDLKIDQKHYDNYAKVDQTADFADVNVKQSGWKNVAIVNQSMDFASTSIDQHGYNNWANVNQH